MWGTGRASAASLEMQKDDPLSHWLEFPGFFFSSLFPVPLDSLSLHERASCRVAGFLPFSFFSLPSFGFGGSRRRVGKGPSVAVLSPPQARAVFCVDPPSLHAWHYRAAFVPSFGGAKIPRGRWSAGFARPLARWGGFLWCIRRAARAVVSHTSSSAPFPIPLFCFSLSQISFSSSWCVGKKLVFFL